MMLNNSQKMIKSGLFQECIEIMTGINSEDGDVLRHGPLKEMVSGNVLS